MHKSQNIPDCYLAFALTGLILSGFLLFPAPAHAEYPLLGRLITAYNLEAHKQSLEDGSYRGEEGLLRITPEKAKSQGMKVLNDDRYQEAKALLSGAEKSLEKAVEAMRTRRKEPSQGHHVRQVVEHFLDHKNRTESARRHFTAYRSALNAVDERLDRAVSMRVLGRLLEESLSANDFRLRDALAHFFNACLGNHGNDQPLSTENVLFVNHVFLRFVQEAPKETLEHFNLDRDRDYNNPSTYGRWKLVMKSEGFPYIAELENTMKRNGGKGPEIDPLLFLALMKRESRFDPVAVSAVGAVGLTQIMPQTGLDLGMKKIYKPDYYKEAVKLIQDERTYKRHAMKALFNIDEKEPLRQAKEARVLMQRSRTLGDQKEKLFARYKRNVLRQRSDERLDPSRAIDYGYRYFTQMMKIQEGDISLALASYNAGPHRVRKYKGIPPFNETVHFRNQVMKYYREYLAKAQGLP